MATDDVADEAVVALDDPECGVSPDGVTDSFLYSVPPQISKYFSDFGRAVRRMQFEMASQVMHTAVEAARANDGEGYGRNTSEVTSWKEIMTAFGQLAIAESHYVHLPFLQNTRQLATKKEAEMRRHYGMTMDSFHRIAAHLLPGTVPHHICEQSLAYCDARDTLIACHRRIVTANESNDEPLDTIEESLQRVCAMVKDFHHPLLSDLAHNFSLESELLRSLIGIQRSVLYTGILETTIRLKELRERLIFWLKDIDWGNNKKGIFSSSLKPTEKWARCRLFAYLHSYHAWLTLKYTFLFHETLGPYVNPLDAPREGDDSMDGLTMHEVLAPIKKREKDALMVILIDRSRDSDMCYIAGRDYKCPREGGAPSALPSGRFPLLYMHAPDKQAFSSHYDEMADAIRSTQAALDEGKRVHVVRRRDKDKYTTYFYERLESRLVVALMIPSKRAERDIGINRFFTHFCATFRGATLAAKWRLS
ncbi:hypothetical protein PENTCL1PPCAC_27805 [Pristionchus entomophagus]|uniref:Uncharacterized protein n=1 Tax=Pristionchus entomophagus TaxID=358040 RepID=A0AAV5UGQ3_9BILA|nr:hypothetical protein PENTCL1PPCAC_27805 [Pristionchus entomophagus]